MIALSMSNDTGSTAFPPLCCPIDEAILADAGEGDLSCPEGHRYPVVRSIPRLLSSRHNYADAFGEQWKKYRQTQLDSYSGTSISHDRLRRCLGSELWEMLQTNRRLDVLEAGCGAGRFTEVLLRCPAAHVTSTDLSEAVEPNDQNCPQSAKHRVVQCDINALPFAPMQFDVVVCLGVVQHTESPEETLASLFQQVKPGGWLVFDHYTHNLSRYTKITALLLRPVLKRLAPETGIAVTERLTRILFPLHKAARRSRLAQILLSRVSPLTTYFHTIPQLNERLQYEWALLDTHDGLTDYYKRLRTRSQLNRTLDSLGAREIATQKGGNGIEVRCRRAAAS